MFNVASLDNDENTCQYLSLCFDAMFSRSSDTNTNTSTTSMINFLSPYIIDISLRDSITMVRLRYMHNAWMIMRFRIITFCMAMSVTCHCYYSNYKVITEQT